MPSRLAGSGQARWPAGTPHSKHPDDRNPIMAKVDAKTAVLPETLLL